jgi:protein-S-isoprenylcysteine O-methyltransferase Ste14/membrane-associated phospholipid phosphatase
MQKADDKMSSEDKKRYWFNLVIFLIIGILITGMIVCFIFVDEPVFSWLRHNPIQFNKNILEAAFEQLGKVYAVVWLLLLWVWLTGRHKTVLIGLLALIITVPAVWSVKAVVKRPRPSDVIKAEANIEHKHEAAESRSFPSGDTASVFAIGTVLAFSARRFWITGIADGCIVVGILRVLDLAHYPSDIFAGAALGIFCGWAAIRIRNKNPKIENVFAGEEQKLAFIGIFLIPILIWLFEGNSELRILLTFYLPAAAIIFPIQWRWELQGRTGHIDTSYADRMRNQGRWFYRWRSFLPLIIVPLFLIELRSFTYPEGSHFLDRLWELFCFSISLLGLGIRIYTVGYVPKRSSGRTTSEPKAQELNRTGMYSIVRHPLYLGNFVIWAGIILFAHSFTLAAFGFLAFFLFYERIILADEAFLSEKFGPEFAQWAQKTPMILPRFKLWCKPAQFFSWQNVLAREYPGLFAIIVSFTAIEIFGDRFYEGKWVIDWMWAAIFCTGLLVFVTLRTFKNKKFRIIKQF